MKLFFIFFVLLIVDQITKILIDAKLDPGGNIPLLENLIEITYVRNKGAALGLLAGHRFILLFIQIAVIIFLLIIYRRFLPHNRKTNVFLTLIFAGAAGNIIDRIRLGYVIDFIDLQVWPVFNFADISIVVGTAGIVWGLWQTI